jgi:hypothetical protein
MENMKKRRLEMDNPNPPKIINGEKVFAKCPYCKTAELIIVAEQYNGMCVDCKFDIVDKKRCIICKNPLKEQKGAFCLNCLASGKNETFKRDVEF